ncbi:MAG: hypothetical protein Q4B42_03010, partial [Oscillospiraceae bacterium]|nr:hypothetical protein [Oscillospiraceae bacterium]
ADEAESEDPFASFEMPAPEEIAEPEAGEEPETADEAEDEDPFASFDMPAPETIDEPENAESGFGDFELDEELEGFGGFSEERALELEDPDAALAEPEGFELEDEEDEESGGFDGFGAFDDFAAEPDGEEFAVDADTVPGNLFETNALRIPLRREDSSVEAIAETLDREMLSRSYNAEIYTDNNLAPEGEKPYFTVRELESEYYLSRSGSEPAEMLEPVSFTLGQGCCCALVSDIPLAVYALARDIAESYDRAPGEYVSLTKGKKDELEIVYLGGDSMLLDDMSCRQYLLMALCAEGGEAVELEEKASALLSQVGLGEMEDEALGDLSHNKRMLVLTLCAAVNPRVGALIINDSSFDIEGVEENIAKRVFALLSANKKSALLACCSKYLIGTVANRVIAFRRGEKVYDGSYYGFIDSFCLGIMSFNSSDPDGTVEEINERFHKVTALCKGPLVYLVKDGPGEIDLDAILALIEKHGADRSSIVMDEKTFDVACREVFEEE